jgi:hypothetical protein
MESARLCIAIIDNRRRDCRHFNICRSRRSREKTISRLARKMKSQLSDTANPPAQRTRIGGMTSVTVVPAKDGFARTISTAPLSDAIQAC